MAHGSRQDLVSLLLDRAGERASPVIPFPFFGISAAIADSYSMCPFRDEMIDYLEAQTG